MFIPRTYVPVNLSSQGPASAAAPPPEPRHGLRVVEDRRRIVRREQTRLGHVLDGRQLFDVAADVVGGAGQLLRLQGRVEDPVRPRVGARSRDPLPVAGVLGDVAVERAGRRSAAPRRASRSRDPSSGTTPSRAGRGCASSPRGRAGASRRRRAGSPSGPPSTPPAPRRRRPSRRRAGADPRAPSPGRAARSCA